MGTCAVEGCGRVGKTRRGWCDMHYKRWWKHGEPGPAGTPVGWVNPLVCVCETPDADPRRDFGMCRNDGCKRKPLELMAVPT